MLALAAYRPHFGQIVSFVLRRVQICMHSNLHVLTACVTILASAHSLSFLQSTGLEYPQSRPMTIIALLTHLASLAAGRINEMHPLRRPSDTLAILCEFQR